MPENARLWPEVTGKNSTVITTEGTNVEVVEDFCYLGSYLSRTGSSDKECLIKIGKAAVVAGRLYLEK